MLILEQMVERVVTSSGISVGTGSNNGLNILSINRGSDNTYIYLRIHNQESKNYTLLNPYGDVANSIECHSKFRNGNSWEYSNDKTLLYVFDVNKQEKYDALFKQDSKIRKILYIKSNAKVTKDVINCTQTKGSLLYKESVTQNYNYTDLEQGSCLLRGYQDNKGKYHTDVANQCYRKQLNITHVNY